MNVGFLLALIWGHQWDSHIMRAWILLNEETTKTSSQSTGRTVPAADAVDNLWKTWTEQVGGRQQRPGLNAADAMQLLVYFGIVAGLGRCLAWTVSPPDAVDCAPRAIKNAVAGALTAGAVAISPAFAAGDVLAGEQVFRNNCAACHAGGQNVIIAREDS
ncbi:cytochrome c6 isoform B [Thalassiosira oceanica]|uniref:Cytochrome c6 isoform B n=1 Tax=Thalassiosira oceanica TaxID=159749 RepID=K0SAQ1_THAOC|nr:cytochrome c6 isoform B [Thalassiosira oceanica]|eukprot:EJK55812.1 cytochrome c6 isoform B [Thalassiosira oceanica]